MLKQFQFAERWITHFVHTNRVILWLFFMKIVKDCQLTCRQKHCTGKESAKKSLSRRRVDRSQHRTFVGGHRPHAERRPASFYAQLQASRPYRYRCRFVRKRIAGCGSAGRQNPPCLSFHLTALPASRPAAILTEASKVTRKKHLRQALNPLPDKDHKHQNN